MHKVQVGEPFIPGRTLLGPITNYNFTGGQHDLLLIFERLSDQDIADVKTAESRFALLTHESIIFFLYRFGGRVKWSDCPYSIWRVPEKDRVPPLLEFTPDTRALLTITLVRAETNIIEVLRAVTLSPSFTRALHKSINEQMQHELTEAAYQQAIASAYARWPKTKDMLELVQAQCKGGE